jgi:tetratricopeptide (TPR) repeat protein/predicted aspartyl protease
MRRALATFALCLISLCSRIAHAECKLLRVMTLPVEMSGLQPTVVVKINGENVHMLIDTGAFFNMLSPRTAARLHLPASLQVEPLYVKGIGGKSAAHVVSAMDLEVGGQAVHQPVSFYVAEETTDEVAGVLGQNFLRLADAEFDLLNGTVRLIKPEGCGDAPLAYWHGSREFGVLDIDRTTLEKPFIISKVMVNGHGVRTLMDTGAGKSMLSFRVAWFAGLSRNSPELIPAGSALGVGRGEVPTWIAPFKELRLDNEVIRNTQLRIGGGGLYGRLELPESTDMVLGADFFLSHRVYVSYQQNKVYFTYNGGPVFNLSVNVASVDPQSADDMAVPATAVPASAADVTSDAPKDAAAFRRRAKAFDARNDLAAACADFDRAQQLDPADPQYAFEAGEERLRNHQPDLALADLDRAILIKPDFVQAIILRGHLRLDRHDLEGGHSDLQMAIGYSSDEVLPLRTAVSYVEAGQPGWAIQTLNDWIDRHPTHKSLWAAFSNRCFALVAEGKQLEAALADCDHALSDKPDSYIALSRRGLAYLRRNELDLAVADFDAALKHEPRYHLALYGRGLAELRRGSQKKGADDIATALSISPNVAEIYRVMGFDLPAAVAPSAAHP